MKMLSVSGVPFRREAQVHEHVCSGHAVVLADLLRRVVHSPPCCWATAAPGPPEQHHWERPPFLRSLSDDRWQYAYFALSVA